MTRSRRDEKDTPFSKWLRSHPEIPSIYGYDGEDIDGTQRFVWHQYRYGYLRFLEIKTYNAVPSYAQRDTQSVVDQALRFAFTHPDFSLRRENAKRPTKIKYLGYALLQFEHTCPDDGGIRIDGKSVTKEEFLSFLKFEDRRQIDQQEYICSMLEDISNALDEQSRWEERERW